jgi:hypothetical protein
MDMEVLFLAYAAITLALLIGQLMDYLTEQERVPLSTCNVIALNNGFTRVASSPVVKSQVQYDRAA